MGCLFKESASDYKLKKKKIIIKRKIKVKEPNIINWKPNTMANSKMVREEERKKEIKKG